jgi:hypothetical protein
MTRGKYALRYAALGFRVVPLHSVTQDGGCSCGHVERADRTCECGDPKCKSKHGTGSIGKHPRLPEWQKLATTDTATITGWWERWPDANVGLAMGGHYFVLDVDPRNGGRESLAALEAEHGPLPETVEAATGGGGSHYLFASDPAHPVGCTKIGPGLDIKGVGGQIVVAPSVSASGAYRWVRPPGKTRVAVAPAWLLAKASKAGPRPLGVPASEASQVRGYFPPASAVVLNEAREALEQHGPAIDGQGGGLHTVQAGAILTHDFALTDDEAWPLLAEWNATCSPPWELDELRAQALGKGRKYGKLPYGCRRALDAVEAVRRATAAWQEAGTGEAGIVDLLVICRPLAAICGDPARHALIERELAQATGLKPKALNLPKLATSPKPKAPGQVRVGTDMHRVADESLAVLAPHVFQRNGVLCEVVSAERAWINDLDRERIQDYLSQHAVYVAEDRRSGELVTQLPPERAVAFLHSRREHPGVRELQAVTTAPVLLANGSILQDRGYNATARLFLDPNVTVWVPEAPTLEDARQAIAQLRDLVIDFPFATPADFSSWLAALLSPLVKPATGNAPGPLICFSAASSGAGKSLLPELIHIIVTGSPMEVRPYAPKDSSEWPKKLTSFVRRGDMVSVFDNVNGAIGDEALDRLITSRTWSDRELGSSDAPPLPNVTTWLANGINIEPVRDTVRRVLMCRLDVLVEDPAARTGFRHPMLIEYAISHRAEFLGAALTILRTYHVAGRPAQNVAPWNSFPAWSALVRGALVWAGCEDPFLTQQRIAADLHEQEHEAHDLWIGVVKAAREGTPRELCLLADQRGAQEVLVLRDSLTPPMLRKCLSRFVDKPRLGERIRRLRSADGTRYKVEAVPR